MKSLAEDLRHIGKAYYTLADLRKITGLSRDSLYVALSRLVKSKSVLRVTAGIYTTAENYTKLDAIANMICRPSYLSFESALSRYGILSQIPYALTFATSRKSMRKKLGDSQVEYRKLKSQLFFGYEKSDDLFIATPEKALVDALYLVSFGKLSLSVDQFDLKEINTKRLVTLVARYPERTNKMISRLVRR